MHGTVHHTSAEIRWTCGGKWYRLSQVSAADDKKGNQRIVAQMMKENAYALLILLYVYICFLGMFWEITTKSSCIQFKVGISANLLSLKNWSNANFLAHFENTKKRELKPSFLKVINEWILLEAQVIGWE